MHSQLIPGLPIQSFGLCIALGVLLSWQILQRLYKKEDMSNLLFLLVFAGLIGARITHVIEYWEEDGYARNPLAIFEIWKGGLVFYGGLVAGAAAFLSWCSIKGRSIAEMANTVAVVVPLAHAFGRLGCFFHGCCWGKVSSSCLAVTFPAHSPVWAAHRASDYAARSLPVLPVQLFEATLLLVLFGLLAFLYKRLGKYTAAAYLIGYSFIRFFTEYLRDDIRPEMFGLSSAQNFSLVMFAFGIVLLAWTYFRNEKSACHNR